MEREQIWTRKPEIAAAALSALFLLYGLLSSRVYFDWLFEVPYLAAAVWLAQLGQTSSAGTRYPLHLWLSAYLFTDSLVLAGMAAPAPGVVLLVYLILSGIYGVVFARQMAAAGLHLRIDQCSLLPWGRALPITLGIAVPLLCLYSPMLRVYQGFQAWSGPVVIRLPQSTYMNAGHLVQFGGTVLVRGYAARLGHLPCLCLAGLALLHAVHVQNGMHAPRAFVPMARIAVGLVILWWLFGAQAYRCLDVPLNLVFIAACAFLLVLLYRLPERAAGQAA